MTSRGFYFVLAVVGLVSTAVAALVPLGDATRAVTVLPAVGAIWAALVELLRDRAAHDRAAALQTTQNSLAVGAASHMASVAFEKHAAFCEEYVADIHQALATLFREGPTSEALRHSSSLYRIRQRWAVWLTPSVE
jgi:hypothetical protein